MEFLKSLAEAKEDTPMVQMTPELAGESSDDEYDEPEEDMEIENAEKEHSRAASFYYHHTYN
ncbi:unnamed protein product, partial [Rotaria socialis]